MPDHPNDDRAEQLLEIGLNLVTLVRDDLAAAHRLVDYLTPADARAMVCILAALVPEDVPVSHLLTWWRVPQLALVPRDVLDPDPPQNKPALCGEVDGYRAHKKAKTAVCEDCRVAWNRYQREQYEHRKAAS